MNFKSEARSSVTIDLHSKIVALIETRDTRCQASLRIFTDVFANATKSFRFQKPNFLPAIIMLTEHTSNMCTSLTVSPTYPTTSFKISAVVITRCFSAP